MTAIPWQLQPADPALVRDLIRSLRCPAPVAHLLVSRGIDSPGAAAGFLHPQLRDLHAPGPDAGDGQGRRPYSRLRWTSAEPILIYGDYDVDGTVATVLLKTAIERIAPPGRPAQVTWHVPHRIREGYGMQGSRLAEAASAGVRLVVSVDTGIRAFAAAEEARALGLDLIVTDHHLPDDYAGVPDALAVLNPDQPGCAYPFKSLCGAAVSFKLAHALLLAHIGDGENSEAQLDRLHRFLLPSFLKLVAIATIADSVPLVGENRVLACLGLQELANPVQPGLRALLQVAGIALDQSPTATEVGFRIAPRINAAGRMDVADDVIELFLTRNPARATGLAEKLNQLNEDRRQTERDALDAIEQHLATLLETHGAFPPETLVLDHPEWHRGVLGILASRVVDRTGRPALVLTHADGQAHGSGRSIPGFHLLDALTAVHGIGCERVAAGSLFARFGGHAHAVGFSLQTAHVEVLRDRLRRHGADILTGPLLTPPLLVDAELPAELLNEELCSWLTRCAPFGNGFTEPLLGTRGLTLAAPPRLIKERHISLELRSAAGTPALRAVGWSRRNDWAALCRQLALTTGSVIDLAYHLRLRSGQWFTGVELEIVGLRLSGQTRET